MSSEDHARVAEELLDLCREPKLGVDEVAHAKSFEWERWRCIREIAAAIDGAVYAARFDAERRIEKAYQQGVADERKGIAA